MRFRRRRGLRRRFRSRRGPTRFRRRIGRRVPIGYRM